MILAPGEFSYRYRVVRLIYVPQPDDPGEETAFGDQAREFRTLAGAEAYHQHLVDPGRAAILQVGLLRWLSHEEAQAEAKRLLAAGSHLG